MTNFEKKVVEVLESDGVIKTLWEEAVKETHNAENVEDTREYARNAFIDELIDYTYDKFNKIEDSILKELIKSALDDADFDNIADGIIASKNLQV